VVQCKITMSTKSPKDERGIVSLMVTFVIIIVISLIVIGFSQVARRNQRSALDRQLSTQAFYAAETGINDVTNLIRSGTAVFSAGDDTDCDGFSSNNGLTGTLDPAGDVRYSCLLVADEVKALVYTTIRNQHSVTAPLKLSGNLQTLTFRWKSNATTRLNAANCAAGAATVLPAATAWGCDYALLRVDLTQDRGLPSAARLADDTTTTFFRPHNTASATPTISVFDNDANRARYLRASCSAGNCQANLSFSGGASGRDYFLRMTALYGDAEDVRVSGLDTGGAGETFRDAQIQIDATGKAQDVLRRVQVRLPLKETSIPGSPLQVTGGACKLIVVVGPLTGNTCAGSPPGNLASAASCTADPHDITLVLDTSSSMRDVWQTVSKIQHEATAARYFVNNADIGAVNKLSIVGFSGVSTVYSPMTDNIPSLLAAADAIITNTAGGTHYLKGLTAAESTWAGGLSRPSAQKVIIFMSDGDANDFADPVLTAQAVLGKTDQLRAAGVRVYTIGVNARASQVPLLTQMTGNGGTYTGTGSEADLATVVSNIASVFDCN
jgi:hypothetical protein